MPQLQLLGVSELLGGGGRGASPPLMVLPPRVLNLPHISGALRAAAQVCLLASSPSCSQHPDVPSGCLADGPMPPQRACSLLFHDAHPVLCNCRLTGYCFECADFAELGREEAARNVLVQLGARFAMRRISVDLAISVGAPPCLANLRMLGFLWRTLAKLRPCCDDDDKEQSSSTELIGGAMLP